MSDQFNKKKQRLGVLYGLVGGIAFSLAVWGFDALVLASSHVRYPFIKFIPGLIFSGLVGCLVGWLSIKIGKGLVTILLWAAYTLLLVWLIIWVPFKITPFMLTVLEPGLMDWIDYPLVVNVEQFRIVAIIVFTVPAIICGLLESNIIDGVLMSSHRGAVLTIFLFCGFLMGLAGLAGDEITSKHFREPIKALDNLFQFAIDHQDEVVDEKLARRMHLSTVKEIEDLLEYERKLTLIAFDDTLAQMDILVNFGGTWVKCTTIYSQPTFCEQITRNPKNYIMSPNNFVPAGVLWK